VRQLLEALSAVWVSLGALLRQEQVQSATRAPAVPEHRAPSQQAAVANMDETGWRQRRRRAWLCTVDRGSEADSIGRWGLPEIERLFPLWHCFRAAEFDRQELCRRLLPLRYRLGWWLRRG